MLTPPRTDCALFLFAHQDDEFAVFPLIDASVASGRRVVCVYLTSGSRDGKFEQQRNVESTRVLAKLGVAPCDLHFLGGALRIEDGGLFIRLDPIYEAVVQAIDPPGDTTLYCPAWEGGHQDHDACHLVGLACALRWKIMARARQFPLYHGEHRRLGLYKVLSPLAANGPVSRTNIDWVQRLRYLRLARYYRSQWHVWLGLLPLLTADYLRHGTQSLQPLDAARAWSRPHAGALLYERRTTISYPAFATQVRPFLERHL